MLWVLGLYLLQDAVGAIGTPIVHEDDLIPLAQPLHRLPQSLIEGFYALPFIEKGDHHRYISAFFIHRIYSLRYS